MLFLFKSKSKKSFPFFVLLIIIFLFISGFSTDFSMKAAVSQNTFTDAKKLAKKTYITYSLPAYANRFFYIEAPGKIDIRISKPHRVCITLYNQYQKQVKKLTASSNICISVSEKMYHSSHRFFLKCSNQKTTEAFLCIRFQNSSSSSNDSQKAIRNNLKKTPQKNKYCTQTTPPDSKSVKKSRKKITSEKKLSTKKPSIPLPNPHFLFLPVHSKQKLAFDCGKQAIHFDDYIWISSNSSIASVQNHTVITKKEGVAVIYARHKKSQKKNASFLIRVFDDRKE